MYDNVTNAITRAHCYYHPQTIDVYVFMSITLHTLILFYQCYFGFRSHVIGLGGILLQKISKPMLDLGKFKHFLHTLFTVVVFTY